MLRIIKTKYLLRSGGLGDVLWTEPLLRNLAKQYKKVVLYTKFVELFENYPGDVIRIKKIPPGWRRIFLKALNLFSGGKAYTKLDGIYEAHPKIHMLHAYQQYFGLPLTYEYPRLHLSELEKTPIETIRQPYVVIHLESNSTANHRNVYGIDWDEVVDFLQQKNINVIQLCKSSSPIKNVPVFNGNIRDMIRLIYKCKFFIGVDSGPSHIAASLNIPLILFFGSVNYTFRHFPQLVNLVIMQKYCEYNGCYHEVIGSNHHRCKLVGDKGIPKCSLHTTDELIFNINKLMDTAVNHTKSDKVE